MTTPCIVQRAECCGPIDLHVERALLVHAGAIGDFVMSLRIVAALRQAGARRVTVLGRPEIARLAIPGGGVDDVLDIETGGYHALFTANGPLPSRVGESLRGIDLAVNMMANVIVFINRRYLQDFFHAFENGLRFQNHPAAAAIRRLVDRPMLIRRKISQVVGGDDCQRTFDRPTCYAVGQYVFDQNRKSGENVDSEHHAY